MSRIGKNPVAIPAGVTIEVSDAVITVKGKLGQLTQEFSDVSVKVEEILRLIFKGTETDHVKYNAKSLETPVPLESIKSIGEQKMAVAVQAMKEKLPNSTLNKVGDLFSFADKIYYILRPFFKKNK
jgi:ribosomal protein L6P/L9E